MPNTLNPLYIFRPGTHTDQRGTQLTFTESDLAACAAAYDPGLHQAPLVVGHPATDAPAWGWVQSLAYSDGRLLATPDRVDPAFAELVNAGRYSKLSASFYLPDSPANPVQGTYYLRHVGFLGAQPPAIKGLGDARFADQGEGVVIVEFGEQSQSPQPKKEPHTMPESTTPPTQPLPSIDQEAAFAEREKKIQEAEAKLAQKEKQLTEQAAAARAKEDTAFVESLVTSGTLLPRHRAPLAAFLGALDESGLVSYSEEGKEVKTPSKQWLKEFLTAMPKQLHFGEHVKPEGSMAVAGIDVPPGYNVDPDRGELFRRATAYAETHGVCFVDAARAVESGRT